MILTWFNIFQNDDDVVDYDIDNYNYNNDNHHHHDKKKNNNNNENYNNKKLDLRVSSEKKTNGLTI